MLEPLRFMVISWTQASVTPRHAAEFWMIEPEMAFADLEDYMDTAEAMIKYVIADVLEKCPDEIDFFNTFDRIFLEVNTMHLYLFPSNTRKSILHLR